jgi:hypothetical protein
MRKVSSAPFEGRGLLLLYLGFPGLPEPSRSDAVQSRTRPSLCLNENLSTYGKNQ